MDNEDEIENVVRHFKYEKSVILICFLKLVNWMYKSFSSTDKNIKIIRLDVITVVRISPLSLMCVNLYYLCHFVYLKTK
jgi:hypothetical protein